MYLIYQLFCGQDQICNEAKLWKDHWIWEDCFWDVIQVNPSQTPNLMTEDDFGWKKNVFDKPNKPENKTDKRRSDFGYLEHLNFRIVKSEEEEPAGAGIGA